MCHCGAANGDIALILPHHRHLPTRAVTPFTRNLRANAHLLNHPVFLLAFDSDIAAAKGAISQARVKLKDTALVAFNGLVVREAENDPHLI